MDEEFFANYSKSQKKKEGIHGIKMNAPLVTNSYTGTIGLELEMEASNRLPTGGYLEKIVAPETKAVWNAINDGSLRGEAKEYIFTAPCTIDELPYMVNGLFGVFRDFKTKLNNSNRCSTHVHINMKGRTINQATSVLAVWGIFEEALVNWCGIERKTNHFALSLQDANSVIKTWDDYLKFGNHGNWSRELKYSALNILTLWDKGSFEFRCGAAADTPDVPIVWGTFLHYFVDLVCQKYKNPASIAYAISERGALEMFEEICELGQPTLNQFKTDVIQINGGQDAFNVMCLRGFRNVQGLCLGFPWDRWMPLIEKEFVPNPFESSKIKNKGPRMPRFDALVNNVARGHPNRINADDPLDILDELPPLEELEPPVGVHNPVRNIDWENPTELRPHNHIFPNIWNWLGNPNNWPRMTLLDIQRGYPDEVDIPDNIHMALDGRHYIRRRGEWEFEGRA